MRTPVRIKARPSSTGYIYGTLADRTAQGLSWVTVHFRMPSGSEATAQYNVEELEQVGPTQAGM